PERPPGKGRVAASRRLGRDLDHQHRRAVLRRRQRRACRRIARADDDHIAFRQFHTRVPSSPLSRRKPGPIVIQGSKLAELVRGRARRHGRITPEEWVPACAGKRGMGYIMGALRRTAMADETVTLARYAAGLRYDDLPANVIACAKDAIADTVAACICGSG